MKKTCLVLQRFGVRVSKRRWEVDWEVEWGVFFLVCIRSFMKNEKHFFFGGLGIRSFMKNDKHFFRRFCGYSFIHDHSWSTRNIFFVGFVGIRSFMKISSVCLFLRVCVWRVFCLGHCVFFWAPCVFFVLWSLAHSLAIAVAQSIMLALRS